MKPGSVKIVDRVSAVEAIKRLNEEDLLGCPVDLVTEKALRPELRPYIEQERVNV